MQIAAALLTMVTMVLALGVCGYLFIAIKRDMYLLDKKRKESNTASESALKTLHKELAELGSQLGDLRKELALMPALGPATAPAGINLNQRTQALRLMRQGQAPENIAATLSLPRNEIELLVKVQKIIFDAPDHATSG